MPNYSPYELTRHHVFVEGPLHGHCVPTEQLSTLMPWLEQYAMTRERATGARSGIRARVWRPCTPQA